MTVKWLKISVFVLMLSFASTASAWDGLIPIAEQPFSDNCNSEDTNSGCALDRVNYASPNYEFISPIQAEGGKIKQIKLYLRKHTTNYTTSSCRPVIKIWDTYGNENEPGHYWLSTYANAPISSWTTVNSEDYTEVTFAFATSSTFTFGGQYSLKGMDFATDYGYCTNELSSTTHAELNSGSWKYRIYVGEDNSTNWVEFSNLSLRNNITVQDFTHWDTTVNLIYGNYPHGENRSYYVEVNWGSSTTTMTNVNRSSNQNITIYPVNEFKEVTKTPTTSPGSTIYAYPKLFEVLDGVATQKATGTIIRIYIAEGNITTLPGVTEEFLRTYTGPNKFRTIFQKKFPFEYAFQMYDIYDYLQTASTTASFTELSLTMPAIAQLKNATTTFKFFSKVEMFKLLPESTWNVLKTLQGAGLVFLTFMYFFHRIKSFRHGGETD